MFVRKNWEHSIFADRHQFLPVFISVDYVGDQCSAITERTHSSKPFDQSNNADIGPFSLAQAFTPGDEGHHSSFLFLHKPL